MSTTFEGIDLGQKLTTGRSHDLWRQLDLARAGRRGVILERNTSDVLVAGSGELVRVMEYLALWAASRGGEVVTMGSSTGVRPLVPPGVTPATPKVTLQPAALGNLVDQLSRVLPTHPTPTTVVVDFACVEFAADPLILQALLEFALDPVLDAGDHQLVLVFRTASPPPQLTTQPGWATIPIELPGAEERLFVLRRTDDRAAIPRRMDLSLNQIATTLGGMDIDAILRLSSEARHEHPVTIDRLIELKSTEIRRLAAGTLAVDSSAAPNGLAGMANLRLYVDLCQLAGVPLGAILLAGVPGVGKTYSWRWLANYLGLPAVRFAQLRGPFVGESERAMQRARTTLGAMQPCVVLIDEADQTGLGRRGMNLDAGVSDRLRTELFEMLNECEIAGNVFVLATNNPAGIDPAALDRVTVLPVVHPSLGEAVEIMRLSAEREGWELDLDGARGVLAGHDLLTGRQVVRLLKRANLNSAEAGHEGRVDGDDLRVAADDTIEHVDRGDHEYMGLCAIALADSQSALPWVAAGRLGETCMPPIYVQQLLDSDGRVDMGRVHARVAHLRQAGHGFHL